MSVVLPWGRCLLVAAVVALLAGCAAPAAAPASGQLRAAPRPQDGMQPTATPLPTSTPSPLQPTNTPLPTAPPSPTQPPRTSVPARTLALPAPTTAVAARPDARAGSGELRGGDAMLAAINAARLGAACAPLTPDARLQAAADAHALDLATRGVIDHQSADGATLQGRLDRAGYPFARRSEVVGRGSGAAVLAAWLAEPAAGPHRGALLDCAYAEVGIRQRVAPDGRTYWVAILATERSP